MGWGFRPYVPVGARRAQAERALTKLAKGRAVAPVRIEGRSIARSFWGRSWCENLERYSDYANRLPRGRTYVRNGSVVDLQVAAGLVRAYVAGSELYTVEVKVAPVPKERWQALCRDCSHSIDSVVELLQGHLSKGVMERVCRQQAGLFPSPSEIRLACSCPDWAAMCKHVAAVLYGIGARLDERPELLFELRQVEAKDLVAGAHEGLPLGARPVASQRLLRANLAELFGVELAEPPPTPAPETGGATGARGSKARPVSRPKAATKRGVSEQHAASPPPGPRRSGPDVPSRSSRAVDSSTAEEPTSGRGRTAGASVSGRSTGRRRARS
jgi:hypothetical protein